MKIAMTQQPGRSKENMLSLAIKETLSIDVNKIQSYLRKVPVSAHGSRWRNRAQDKMMPTFPKAIGRVFLRRVF